MKFLSILLSLISLVIKLEMDFIFSIHHFLNVVLVLKKKCVTCSVYLPYFPTPLSIYLIKHAHFFFLIFSLLNLTVYSSDSQTVNISLFLKIASKDISTFNSI